MTTFETIKTYNVKNLQTRLKDNELLIKTTNLTALKCKIILDCDNAKKLSANLVAITKESDDIYDKTLDSIIKEIKDKATSLNVTNIQQFANNIDVLKCQINKSIGLAQRARHNIRKISKMPSSKIICKLYLKNKEVEGYITSINLARKSVDIEFINENNNKEKLLAIDISKLCIEGKNCIIEIGKKTEKKKQSGGSMSSFSTSDAISSSSIHKSHYILSDTSN